MPLLRKYQRDDDASDWKYIMLIGSIMRIPSLEVMIGLLILAFIIGITAMHLYFAYCNLQLSSRHFYSLKFGMKACTSTLVSRWCCRSCPLPVDTIGPQLPAGAPG